MKKIALMIEGQKKEFVQTFVPAVLFRKTLEIQDKLKAGLNPETVDELIEYIVIAFSEQFTVDECYKGLDARFVLSTVTEICAGIISGGADAIGAETDPNE